MKAVHVTISGFVQGVGYRAWTEAEARARGLRGWVRNRRDGTVEAVFNGDPATVDGMVNALWRGPPGSRVAHVVATPTDEPAETGFRVQPTA